MCEGLKKGEDNQDLLPRSPATSRPCNLKPKNGA